MAGAHPGQQRLRRNIWPILGPFRYHSHRNPSRDGGQSVAHTKSIPAQWQAHQKRIQIGAAGDVGGRLDRQRKGGAEKRAVHLSLVQCRKEQQHAACRPSLCDACIRQLGVHNWVSRPARSKENWVSTPAQSPLSLPPERSARTRSGAAWQRHQQSGIGKAGMQAGEGLQVSAAAAHTLSSPSHQVATELQ